MVATERAPDYVSYGLSAHAMKVRTYTLDRAIELGVVPRPHRFGRFRYFDRANLPAMRQAMLDAGLIQEEPAHA